MTGAPAQNPSRRRDRGAAAARPLWTCPKCGAKLVTRNMWHSCGAFTTEALLEKCGANARAAFAALESAVTAAAADAVLVPQKTRAVFQLRTRFISVYPRRDHLLVGFILTARASHPRFVKIEGPITKAFIHYVRLAGAKDVDRDVKAWIRAALPYGRQDRPLGRSAAPRPGRADRSRRPDRPPDLKRGTP